MDLVTVTRSDKWLTLVILTLSIITFGYAGIPKGSVCPEDITVGWRDASPYLILQDDHDAHHHVIDVEDDDVKRYNLSGIIIDIVSKGFRQCCRNNVTLWYEERFTDITKLVEASVNSSLDIVLPIRTTFGKKSFLTFPYIGLVESPGAVFYNLNHRESHQALVNTLMSVLPAVFLLLVWVCAFGILFWICDVIPRKAETSRPITIMLTEMCDSVWWAFVTLATVGYGDVVPTRLPGRLLCYIWLILSSVAIACFSASVTSILIAECFNSELTIEGTKIGVINGSREHSLVLRKSGLPQAYNKIDDLLYAVHHDHLEGLVMDLYTASYYSKTLQSFRIQKVFEDITTYGVVLRTRTVHLRSCFMQYIYDNQREIYAKMKDSFPPLKSEITSSSEEETSQSLLSPKIKEIQKSFIAITSILLILSIFGIATEKYRCSTKKKKLKDDDMENFALLHTIKNSYQESLHNIARDLNDEINNLRAQIDATMKNVDGFSSNPDTIFRAIQNNDRTEEY